MKIVISGLGSTAFYLVRILQKDKNDLVLIDNNRGAYQHARENFDAQIMMGDASDPTTLEPVIDETVDLYIALTDNDEANIISTLIARKFGVQKAIARISDPNKLIHPLLTDDPHVFLLNSEMIVSKDLTRMVGTPSADEIEFFAKGKAEMVTLHVDKESHVINMKLRDIVVPQSWVIVATIRKGSFTIASGETEFQQDDQVLAVGDPKKFKDIEELLGLEAEQVRRVILIGYNEVSSRLSGTLKRKGVDVRLIEQDEEKAQEAASELDNILVLQGDGTDEEILNQAGIEDTDYLIALTEDDETNVLISLLAKEQKVSHVVTMTQKTHYKKIIQKIGIDSVINPRSALADEILRCVHHRDLLGINTLEGGQGRMMEFVVNKKTRLIDQPLSKVKLPKQILIGAIIRNDQLIVPRGNTRIRVGDHVIVFSTLTVLSEVRKLFGN